MYAIEYTENKIVVKKEGLPSYSMRIGVLGKIFFGKGDFNLDNYLVCGNVEITKPRAEYTVFELIEMYDKAAKFYVLRTKDNIKV